VGVIGLGVGTIAAYGQSGDEYKFYEINPLVVQIAREDFRFLQDSRIQERSCPSNWETRD